MKLTELIALAQLKLQLHGDINVLSEDYYPIQSLNHQVSDGSFDEDWGLPEGTEFIRIFEDK